MSRTTTLPSARRSRFVLGLLGVTGAILLYGFFQWVRLHPSQVRLARLENSRIELGRKVRALEVNLPKAPAGSTPAARENAPSKLTSPVPRDDSHRLVEAIYRDGALAEKYRSAERASLGVLYGPIFRSLKLPIEQQNRVLDLLTQRAQNLIEVEATTNGAPAADKTDQVELSSSSDLQNLLGAEPYASFQQYQSTMNARLVLSALAGNTYYDHPLTAEQSGQLVTALATAVPTNRPIDPVLTHGVPPGTDWDAAVEAVTPFLGPEQLKTFQTIATLNKDDAGG
jgi:hypothetical protein